MFLHILNLYMAMQKNDLNIGLENYSFSILKFLWDWFLAKNLQFGIVKSSDLLDTLMNR